MAGWHRSFFAAPDQEASEQNEEECDEARSLLRGGFRKLVGPIDSRLGNVRSARRSATKPEEVPLGVRRCHRGCTLVGGRGLAVPAEPPKQIGSWGTPRANFWP